MADDMHVQASKDEAWQSLLAWRVQDVYRMRGHGAHHAVEALLRALTSNLAGNPVGRLEDVQRILRSQLKDNPGNYLGNHSTLHCIWEESPCPMLMCYRLEQVSDVLAHAACAHTPPE